MSKINTQYWGANTSPIELEGYTYSYGRSTNSIKDLIAAGKYDPNTDSFDLSVSPWGIGYSAAGNRGVIIPYRRGSIDGSNPGILSDLKFEGIDTENVNRPFTLIDDNNNIEELELWFRSRVGGDVTVDSNNNMCETNLDGTAGAILQGNSSSDDNLSNAHPITYLNYQDFRLVIDGFSYINLDTGSTGVFFFRNSSETAEQSKQRWANWTPPENMAVTTVIIHASAYASYSGQPTGWSSQTIGDVGAFINLRGHTVSKGCLNISPTSNDVSEDAKFKMASGWSIGLYDPSYGDFNYYVTPLSSIGSGPYVKNIPVEDYKYTVNTSPYLYTMLAMGCGMYAPSRFYNASNYSDAKHSFSGITYKMKPISYYIESGEFHEFALNTPIVGFSGIFRVTSVFDVESSSLSQKEQILAICKHETAFYGFEFVILWGNETLNQVTLGSEDFYLPKFDEHLITTGEYVGGQAALNEPNATWGNVFGDDMPEYDYNYNPAPGDLDPLPDEDGGFINMRHYQDLVLLGSNQYYAMNASELIQFITDVNGQYADTQPIPSSSSDLEQRLKELQYSFFQKDINWKGSNPNDYIVGVYAYPFSLPHATSTTGVKVGPVTTSVTAHIVETRSMLRTTYGEITVRGSKNFLDYAPYTQLQLYLPMLGIIELDPAYYVGAKLSVDYVLDINTGSLSGIVYRNGTIDKVVESNVAAQVPITARNMGDYQNAVQQAKQALMSSVIGGTQKGASMITGMVQTGASSAQNNNPIAALSTNITDLVGTGFSIGQNIGTSAYNLTHMSPNVSTVSTASSANSMQLERTAVLMYRYAKFLPGYNAENYGHTVGFACCINDQIKAVEGFTVATDIDTSGIPATAEEIQMIRQAFANGVYV